MSEATTMAVDIRTAEQEIGAVWENGKKNGLELGEVCYKWRARLTPSKGGYGSKGKGLAEILGVLDIPRHIAEYWMYRYEVSIGVREAKVKVPQSQQSGLDALNISYTCSACNGTFEVTADKVQPHYAENPAVHGTWHLSVTRPDIKGWSSMNAKEKLDAARAAGCPYCLKFDSSRSCPAHGWEEKRNDHFNEPPPAESESIPLMPAEDVPTIPIHASEDLPKPTKAIVIKAGMMLDFHGRLYEVRAGWRDDPDDKRGAPAVYTPYLKFMFPNIKRENPYDILIATNGQLRRREYRAKHPEAANLSNTKVNHLINEEGAQ